MSQNEAKTKAKAKGGRPPQSGAFSVITKGSADELPARRRYIRPYLIGAREGWIRDIGGTEEGLTTSQRVLIDRAVTFLGAIRLVEEYLRERGLFKNPGGLLNAHLTTHYLAWNRALVDCLRLLGIDKRQVDKSMTPLEIAAEIDAEKAQEAAASGPGRGKAGRRVGGEGDGEARGEADTGDSRQEETEQASELNGAGRSPEDEAHGTEES